MENWKKILLKSCIVVFSVEFVITFLFDRVNFSSEVIKIVLDSCTLVIVSGLIIYNFIIKKYVSQNKDNLFELDAYRKGVEKHALVSVTDAKGKIVYANNRFVEVSKYSKNELIGQDHRLLNSGTHNSNFFKLMWEELKSGKVWRGQITNRTKDGSLYWVDTTITPVFDDKGNIKSYISIRYDVTQQVQTLNTNTEQKNFYESILDTMSEGYVVKNEEGKTIHLNKASLQILGVKPDEFIGKPSDNSLWYCVKEDGSVFNEEDHPSMVVLKTGKPVKDVVMGVFQKDNSVTWIKINSVPFYNQGKLNALTTFSDISSQIIEKKKIEDNKNKLKQQQEDFKMISSTLHLGIWKWDLYSDEIIWDEALYTLFDINKTTNSLSVRSIWNKYVEDESKLKMRQQIDEAILNKKDVEFTVKIKTIKNVDKYVGVKGFVVRDAKGTPIKIYGFNWDKTSHEFNKKALELEKLKVIQSAKLSSLGEMSAGIAHEINNPLMVIDANLSLLAMIQNDPAKVEAKVESARGAVKRITKIVSGLRKFSRASDSSKHSIFFSSVIRESLNLTEIKAKKNEVTIELNNECETLMVNGNELELEQILINLINNAIDAVKSKPKDKRWVKINVSTTADGSKMCCEIIDAGNGIPVQYIQKLYDPFFTTKPVGEGTGLGLSIAKGIIDDHQGELLYDDKSPNTCFKIILNKVS